MKYVIDFEMINELTSHPNDLSLSNGYVGQISGYYSVTKKCIKFYMDMYLEYNGSNSSRHLKISEDKYMEAIDVLHWNKILVSISDIRDGKIDRIIQD